MDRTPEPMIRLDAVSKRFPDGTVAVDALDLDVPAGQVVALVGPSGCGKTTTLKMVNRLVQPTSGRVVLDGEDVTDVDQVRLRRRIGYVIQTAGLFPHRTILENVTTVPQLLGWDRARTRARGLELLELVGLDPDTYARRYPHQLSGGQRQRVGVARALAADPPVLLMDEPFGAVDPVVRERLQSEFMRLQQEVRKTVLLVTHDLDEAVRLGDRIAVLSQGGRLEQYDPPAVVLGSPATGFVRDFVGADRQLKQLAVTPVRSVDLAQPPVVHLDDPLAAAGQRMGASGWQWAVVVDPAGALQGWLPRSAAGREGAVRDVVHRVPACLPATADLKQALNAVLQHDAGWVAVLNGDRYLGILTPAAVHQALRRAVEAADAGGAGTDAPAPSARG